jgi:preprotein translocase subunit SecE
MSTQVETSSSLVDRLKWVVAIAILIGAIAAFYHFAEQSVLFRVIGLLAAAALSGAILSQTDQGRAAWAFVREANVERRKVVWPTRKETTQTTGIVIAMVTLVALFLWALDSILSVLIRMVLGQGA